MYPPEFKHAGSEGHQCRLAKTGIRCPTLAYTPHIPLLFNLPIAVRIVEERISGNLPSRLIHIHPGLKLSHVSNTTHLTAVVWSAVEQKDTLP